MTGWHFEDLVAKAYAFEGSSSGTTTTAHHVVEFTPTSDEHYQPFNLMVDADSTCSIRLEASLYVVVEGKYIEVFQGSDNLYPNCNYEGVFNQFSLTVLDQTTQEYNAPYSIGNGDQSFRFDLSGLIDNRTYHLMGTSATRSRLAWANHLSERPDYVQVDMTSEDQRAPT